MRTRVIKLFLWPALIAGLGLTLTLDDASGASGVADLSLGASVSNGQGWPTTSNLIYSITVSNAGPSMATGVVVSNQIPANAIYTNVISGGLTFINVTFISATGGATPTNGVLLLNLGSLAGGATNSIQIVLQVTNNGGAFGTSMITNVLQVFADQTDPDLTNNSATVVCAALNGTTYTYSSAEYGTTNTMTVNQQVNEYSTELIAKMPGGPVVFDQTFNAPYSNATVQAAVMQAVAALTAAGANSYTGPTSFSQTVDLINSSSITVPTSTNINVIFGTKTFIGPQTILIGDFGVVHGYTFDPAVTNYAIPTTWSANPICFFIFPGGEDIDTRVFSLVDLYQTTTTTATYLNSAVYVMTGIVAQADLSLSIAHLGNGAVVFWPDIGSYTLQQNSNLATGSWTTSGYSITTANGTNSITISPPVGNFFFRLRQ